MGKWLPVDFRSISFLFSWELTSVKTGESAYVRRILFVAKFDSVAVKLVIWEYVKWEIVSGAEMRAYADVSYKSN
jgi:hypothetical protein